MDTAFTIPKFDNEADEARWWFENQHLLAEQFKLAAAKGELGRSTMTHRGPTPTTTIRLDPEDISKARAQAKERGLKYQTYLKMLIHEALRSETKVAR
jgi:predicted DNA binding CopG/RHH family protein